jgi:acyl-CoA synthetase (AMP-forming)/AMP-acid ligase II
VIFRSPYPEVSIPGVSFSDFLLDRCRMRGQVPAFVDGPTGRVLTFAQLAESAESFAAGLPAQGLERGAVVAIVSPNLPEYAVVFIGAIRAGCVVTTINPLLTAGEMGQQLRAKELIKYKAFAIAPAELEALLLTHPAVLDAAVVPSPDAEAGEVPKAFIVTPAEVDLAVLESWVAGQVAPHKRIRRFEVVAQIPRTPSGKILRRVLIEQERAAASLADI